MLKELFYVGLVGLCFIEGDCLNGHVEEVVEKPIEEVELSVEPLVPVGTEFKGCKVDLYNWVGVYKGPDDLYYKVRYNVFSKTLVVEDVSDKEIEF